MFPARYSYYHFGAATSGDVRGIAFTHRLAPSCLFRYSASHFQFVAATRRRIWRASLFATGDLFKCGFESVCLIDSTADVSAVSFSRCRRTDETRDRVVLGPSEDALLLNWAQKPHRELFEQSTEHRTGARSDKTTCARDLARSQTLAHRIRCR